MALETLAFGRREVYGSRLFTGGSLVAIEADPCVGGLGDRIIRLVTHGTVESGMKGGPQQLFAAARVGRVATGARGVGNGESAVARCELVGAPGVALAAEYGFLGQEQSGLRSSMGSVAVGTSVAGR